MIRVRSNPNLDTFHITGKIFLNAVYEPDRTKWPPNATDKDKLNYSRKWWRDKGLRGTGVFDHSTNVFSIKRLFRDYDDYRSYLNKVSVGT